MKPEYREGQQAGEDFRKLATAIFRAPKNGRKQNKKRQPRKAISQIVRQRQGQTARKKAFGPAFSFLQLSNVTLTDVYPLLFRI